MKTRIGIAFLMFAALVAGVLAGGGFAVSAQTTMPDEIQAGCGIPKSYGRLVSVMPGASNGATGAGAHAVFEAEDGTVRWVAMAQGGLTPTSASKTSSVRPAFLPSYECSLSNEWKRH